MNTEVQRKHRIVVGAGVGLIAVIGISVAALDVHRAVPTRHSPAAAPSALSDTSTPQTGPASPTVPPPPMSDSAPPPQVTPPTATSPDAAVSAPEAPSSAPIGAAASGKAPKQVTSDATSTKRSSGARGGATVLASNTPTSKVAEETAMAKVAAPTAENGERNEASADVAAISAATDSRSVPDAPQAAASPAPAPNGEVTTTMEARAAGADSANADRLITSAVKSQIAADAAEQGANLAVTTVNGVVILTGTVPTADAAERVKQLVQQVQDVKGVDATAVKVSSS